MSARGSSFVERLRNMQLTAPLSNRASSSAVPPRPVASTAAKRTEPAPAIRPTETRSTKVPATSAAGGAALRRAPSSKEQLSHSSGHVTQAGATTAGVVARNGRNTPPPGAWNEPTGGRSGPGSPPPRSLGKSPTRDTTPVTPIKTQANKPATIRAGGSVSPTLKEAKKPQLKVGITLMTRKPHRFDWWLRYHRSLGIYHVFVHVEDTPELLPLLDSAEFKDFVTVTTGEDNSLDTHNPNSSDNYYTLMQRQERQVRRSVQSCRQAGIEWLFHVDDDELLYFDTPFSKIVDSLPREVTCVVLVNIEAVPDTLTSECIFEDIQVFTQHKMLAYRNGKSAGRCADADWHGPHRFTGNYHVVPVTKACVLHFESCLYETWRNKFIKHREIEEQKKKDIPFPFYRQSIELFQHDHDGGKNEERWKAFFMEKKVGNFKELTESQKTRYALSTNMPEMIGKVDMQ